MPTQAWSMAPERTTTTEKEPMETTLRENIDWVGYVDWTVRDFHGYDTEQGTTYNAYLIRDEKTALIDAVKPDFGRELLQHVAAKCDLADVDYVVCNHAEPDHSGALPQVIEAMPNAVLVCDKKCEKALSQHYDTSAWKFHIVAEGDTLSLGRRTLTFIETPMVHWPESMFTYVPEEKLLFSMDAFGQHYATSPRFDDELPIGTIMDQAKAYYANIVMPYGKNVVRCLEKAATLDIEMIAPSHGIIWRGGVAEILKAYHDWSAYRPQPKVLVIYDTMWQSTDRMARAILEGASQPGVQAMLINIRRSNLTRIATEVLDCAAVAMGSSTLNRGMMPMVGAVLTYLKGLRPSGKAGFAFGSYGWGKGGPKEIHAYLEAMKWEILRDPLMAQYRPTPEILEECRRAGAMLAERTLEITAET